MRVKCVLKYFGPGFYIDGFLGKYMVWYLILMEQGVATQIFPKQTEERNLIKIFKIYKIIREMKIKSYQI